MPTQLVPWGSLPEISEQELDRLIQSTLAESVRAAKPAERLRQRIMAAARKKEKQPPRGRWVYLPDDDPHPKDRPLICHPYAIMRLGAFMFFGMGLPAR